MKYWPGDYLDEQTGTRLTVEDDIPEHPRISIILPDRISSLEEVNGALQRLLSMANVAELKRFLEFGNQPQQGGQQ